MADNYFKHQESIKNTKLKITKRFPKSCRLFSRPIGVFYKKRVDGGVIDYTPITIGRKGQCDEWGVIGARVTTDIYKNSPIIPVHIELEFKTGSGKLNPDQENWRDFCLMMGWVWILVREETDVIKEIENAVRGKGLWLTE